ncbi:MAG TPA: hypothetical protein VJI75_05135 [Candidatus Nanoarchaeia archaeon]|nr:hypothetical protein [Candidatus Nanoarchaeia archaeon]
MTIDQKTLTPEFSLRDDSLPMLVAEAAIDIDNYANGRSKNDGSVIRLSHILNSATSGDNPIAKDVNNSVVLAYAVSGKDKFEEYWKHRSHVDELVLQINLAAKDLRDFKSLSESQQDVLMKFCVNLSREIANHQDEYYPIMSRFAA